MIEPEQQPPPAESPYEIAEVVLCLPSGERRIPGDQLLQVAAGPEVLVPTVVWSEDRGETVHTAHGFPLTTIRRRRRILAVT